MSENALKCEYKDCELIYENPITLPCGNSMCKSHLDQYNCNFKCYFCNDEHEIPENGFSINKTIIKMIDSIIESNPIRKKINESFEKINESISEYENLHPDVYIYEYFEDIRLKVDLHREELKKEIDEKSDEIIKKLKDKEEKCKSNSVNVEKIKLKNMNSSFTLKNMFRVPNLTKKELNNLTSKINNQLKFIQNELNKYKKSLLLNESIKFDKFEKSSLFGELLVQTDTKKTLSNNFGMLIKLYSHKKTINEGIKSVKVCENKNKLIISSRDESIRILDLESCECLKTLNGMGVCDLIISDESKFITGSSDKSIKIWDLNSYECLNTLTNESNVHCLCLISNDKIACGCLDGSINIWNLNSLIKVKSFKSHDEFTKNLLLVDNSKLISCSGFNDLKIKVWCLETYECIKELVGHTDLISCLELTSDGENLLSSSKDQTIKLWQLNTGKILKSIKLENHVWHTKVLNSDLIAVDVGTGLINEINIYSLSKMKTVKKFKAHHESLRGIFHSVFIVKLHLLSNGNLMSACVNGEIKTFKIFE